MKIVAIITARGGSKRIPRKNIKDFLGKPIIAYSICAALDSGIFDEVMVSTDDEEIAQIARNYGAKTPFMRSEKNSDDHATSYDVIGEVLNDYEKIGQKYDYLCCIYPTAPFVSAKRLKECFALMKEKGADALVPVVKFSFPPQRAFIVDNNYLKYKWSENRNVRSQDLQPFYHDAGQFYFVKIKEFWAQKSMVLEKTMPYELDEMEVQDIDNQQDWDIAEIKYQKLN